MKIWQILSVCLITMIAGSVQGAGKKPDSSEQRRTYARRVYKANSLVWEIVPDEEFDIFSLSETIKPAQKATVHTVINALEATALGVANLTKTMQPLIVSISGGSETSPKVTPRVARFFKTVKGKHIVDALLAIDCPQSIPAGESKLVWIGVESSGVKPGVYKYEIAIKIGDFLHKIPLKVFVHNVTLSKKTPLTTFNWAYLDSGYDVEQFATTRDVMLKHRINTAMCTSINRHLLNNRFGMEKLDGCIEFSKDFPQLGFYWSFHQRHADPTRGMFGASWMSPKFKANFKKFITTIVARLKEKGRSYDKFHFQFFDETTSGKLVELCKLVHEIDPEIRTMITIHSTGNPKELVDAGMDIITFHAPYLGDEPVPAFSTISSAEKELWLYNAGDTEVKGNGRARDSLGTYRLLHWLAFRHGAKGVGFWNMLQNKKNCWGDSEMFFPLVYTIPPRKGKTPPDIKTAETVIPSRRLEHVRMGIEDYMLLRIAQEKISKLKGLKSATYRRKLANLVRSVTLTLPKKISRKERKSFRRKRVTLIKMIESLNARLK